MGYGAIGSTPDFGSVNPGSSPGIPALKLRERGLHLRNLAEFVRDEIIYV